MPRSRSPHRRRLLRRGSRRPARGDGGPVVPDRTGARVRLLPVDRRHPRRRAQGAGDVHPSGLRVPGGAGALRAGDRGRRVHVRRSVRRSDRDHGRQGGRAPGGRPQRRADRAGDAGAGRHPPRQEASRARRVPAAREGGVRRRRQGHARRARRRSPRRGAPSRRPRGAVVLRPARGVPGALRRPRPPRGGAGDRGHARERVLPGRTRLLGPAPPPEADRGDALPRDGRAAADEVRGGRDLAHEGVRLRQRRHDRMHRRRGRLVLLPGDEHAAAGRAHRHGDGDRLRPGRAPAAGGDGREARPGQRAARCGDPVPDQRRGPGAQLPPRARPDHPLRRARRAVRAGGLRRHRRPGDPRRLRLDVREADRLR